ncbi:hypothetical protein AB0C07_05755 [Actinoplanes missouriensis]|uniref:hypothetical protein n=1 Tax=Actinoplanes missouriensis TaxID=1866 RepID=UPI0033C40333
MRHLRSILYALVLAPSIWILAGVGFTDDLSSRGRDFFAAESVSGLLLVLFAGILYAILTFAPVSPAGPVLAGVAYLSVTIWAWNSPAAYAALWSPEVSKEGFDLSRPGYGLAALLAIPLIGTALSARRWARYEPPVLPIIGEIGRFRGKATVSTAPLSIAETTVIRAGRPITDDRTVAIPAAAPDPAVPAADRTVAVPGADRTVAFPTNDRTVAVRSADQTVAIADTDKTAMVAAPKPTATTDTTAAVASPKPTVTAPSEDRTMVFPAATDKTVPVSADKTVPVTADKTGEKTTEKAVETVEKAAKEDEETHRLDKAAVVPGQDEPTTLIPAQRSAPASES